MKTFRALALVALSICHAAMAQSAPSAKESPFAIAPAVDQRSQLHPVVAYDGSETFLVVWQQGRRYFEQQEGDIFAVRIDRGGRVLDAKPIVICGASGSQEVPQVEYSNGVFLVTWQDYRNGRQWAVYGARVTSNGRVLDPDGFPIAAEAGNNALPQIAPTSQGFLVAWQALAGGYYELRAAAVSAQGTLAKISLSNGGKPLHGGTAALSRFGRGWLLGWNDQRAWARGGETREVTRRFARLNGTPDKLAIAEVQPSPAQLLGREGGRLIAGGDRVLFTGWGLLPRGRYLPTAALFDASSARALKNPNKEQEFRMSGWDTTYMFPLFPMTLAADGPVAGDFACDLFLVVTRTREVRRQITTYRMVAARIALDGRRLDADDSTMVVHESALPIANPALRFGSDNVLMVFEGEDASGNKSIHARMLRNVCAGSSTPRLR